jgi:hypothetical protein
MPEPIDADDLCLSDLDGRHALMKRFRNRVKQL